MNVYIRFFFESYLELCLSSLLRLEMLVFGVASSTFHSTSSIVIFMFLVLVPVSSAVYLQIRSKKLD